MSGEFLETFEKINHGISSYMRKNGYSNLNGMIGDAHN